MDFQMPEQWREWTATDFLGEGSYGRVYKAENAEGEVCAIKLISIPKTEEEANSMLREYGDEESARTFYSSLAQDYEKEIELLKSLADAENIVRIYDYFCEPKGVGWRMYIRMEYLQSFNEYCDVHEITEERAVEFALDICSALSQCEKLGIVHRDLKPENILVDAEGRLKLCDFGLARTMDASRSSYSIKGTFSYMAPEIYLGKKYNAQVDIYSLGIILYRLMNKGREPFIPVDKRLIYYKDKETALSRRMEGEKIPDPADASPEMAAIILKACAFLPEDRYKTAEDMKQDLLRLKRGKYRKSRLRTSQRKKLIAALAVVCLAAAAGFGYLWTNVLTGVHASLSALGVLTVYGDQVVTEDTVAAYRDKAKSIVIRDGIPTIGENCFDSFEEAVSIEIPDSVTEIGAGAFASCTSLEKVDLSEANVVSIGAGAFAGCANMRECALPDDLELIDAALFEGCSGLEKIDLSGSRITNIEENAFNGCSSLEEVRMPDSVERIGISAFQECESLKSVSLGAKTAALGDTAFCGCSALTDVEGVEHVTSFGGDVFTGTPWEEEQADPEGFLIAGDVLLRYLGKASSVKIPRAVHTIGNSAFTEADTVRELTVGSNVSDIDDYAFAYSMIQDFIFEDPSSIERIGEGAFSQTPWLQMQLAEADSVHIGEFTIREEE